MGGISLNNDDLIEIVKRITNIEREIRKPTSDNPAFRLYSENSPSMLTASMNDYDPGNYDVIRLESNAAISITGFLGGMLGRELRIYNVGGYVITLSHQSSSSLQPNRILTYNSTSITLNPNARAILYYDFTTQRWRYNG